MPVTTDDYVSISDFLGRYCWLVDSNEEDAWSALWLEDGVFTGVTPEPLVGHEALKTVPRNQFNLSQGKMRHHYGNLHCDYAEGSRDEVRARYYNNVSMWKSGGSFVCMALCDVQLVRKGAGWLIRRNDTTLLT
jgi:3-phenylpropionate/cinnamic acid dioxygenase small subunit